MKFKDERGFIMIEATYCIMVAIFVMVFLLGLGFYLYQNTVVTIVANEIAEEVSQTYKLRDVEDSSDLTAEDIEGIGKYRYLFFSSSFNEASETKLFTAADVRLSQTSLADSAQDLNVEVETVVDDIGRRHYVVTVSQTYSYLFGGLLEFVGLEDAQLIERTVYVESSDVLSYINTVKLTNYIIDKAVESNAITDIADSLFAIVEVFA